MNDSDLKKKLSALSVPPPAPKELSRAFHHAVVAFAQHQDDAPSSKVRPVSGWRAWSAWGAVAGVAVGVFAAALLLRFSPSAPAPVAPLAAVDLRTLSEVEELFPGQVNAVIERDGRMELDLSPRSREAGGEQPLIVQLEGFGHRLRVLSYSGRNLTLEVGDRRLSFEVLVTGDGDVVLAGADFAWTSAQPGLLAGYRIQAQSLASPL